MPIVKYYRSKAASEGAKTVSADLAAGGIQNLSQGVCSNLCKVSCKEESKSNILAFFVQDEEDPNEVVQRLSSKELLYQNIDYALDIFLIYVQTSSIFPGFLSEDTGSHSLGSWCVSH